MMVATPTHTNAHRRAAGTSSVTYTMLPCETRRQYTCREGDEQFGHAVLHYPLLKRTVEEVRLVLRTGGAVRRSVLGEILSTRTQQERARNREIENCSSACVATGTVGTATNLRCSCLSACLHLLGNAFLSCHGCVQKNWHMRYRKQRADAV